MHIQGIQAVVFDMDGTLTDSEGLTEQAIASVLADHGVDPGDDDETRYHGLTWASIAATMNRDYPQLAGAASGSELQAHFHARFVNEPPQLIEGAREAVLAAAEHHRVAIASSSNRESVEHLVDRLRLHEAIPVRVCAEDVQRSKPHPDGYLEAAARLGCDPARCLVFEDSLAGLRAARAAGARTAAITHGKSPAQLEQVHPLADLQVRNYTALPAGFFQRIGMAVVP
jgi:HAD superfamily hydrolase (TIGR01509 family)